MLFIFNLLLIFCYILLAPLLLAVAFVAISVILGRGAVYVPADNKVVATMVELAKVKPGDKAVDLGSGDGRIVIALARAGAETHGFEINPILVWLARRKIQKARLNKKAFIHWKSFWGEDLSKYQIVTVFGVEYIMSRLEKKLKRESRKESRIVSYIFPFPSWQYARKEKGVYLYKI